MRNEKSGDDGRAEVEGSNHPIVPPPREPPGNQTPAAQASETARLEQDIRTGEIWLIALQTATVLVGIYVAIIYGGQLQQMVAATQAATRSAQVASDALETSQSQFDRSMSQTISQTGAQLKSAEAAMNSVKITQEEMRLDQRAWVVLKNPGDSPEKDKPWVDNIEFTNTGKTPALDVNTNCTNEWVTNESSLHWFKAEEGPRNLAPPNQVLSCSLNVYHGNFTEEAMRHTIATQMHLFIYGSVTYKDIFKQPHWMTFCDMFSFDPLGFRPCKNGNATGDGTKLPAPFDGPPRNPSQPESIDVPNE